MDIDPYFGNNVGDNLTDEHEDDQDENEAYNWVNNPIRKLFDNPKNQYERSHLEPPIPADD
jgi:hypothetical protein